MVTIQNLDVRFDIQRDNDKDQIAFAEMFEKYIRQWNRLESEARSRQRFSECERALADDAFSGGE